MFLSASFSKVCFLIFLVLLPNSSLLAEDKNSIAKPSELDAFYNREYRSILRNERRMDDDVAIVEDVASGVAALLIGLYGYYNDDRGILTKLAYNATMTAGILLVSDAVLQANKPSLLLLTDQHLRKKGRLNRKSYKRGIVNITRKIQLAEYKQIAYTSGILGTVYLYNAYRENVKGLKNVYYFLSFNFILVASSSAYKATHFKVNPSLNSQLSFSLAPLPVVTWNF